MGDAALLRQVVIQSGKTIKGSALNSSYLPCLKHLDQLPGGFLLP